MLFETDKLVQRLDETGFYIETPVNPCVSCASQPVCRQVAATEGNIAPGSLTCQRVAESEEESVGK